MLGAAPGSRHALAPEQLAALLSPPPERPRRVRWLLFAIGLHALALGALLASTPARVETERIVRVHLLPGAIEESAPGTPAATPAPAPPVVAPTPPPKPPRAAVAPAPKPTPKPVAPIAAPAPTPEPAPVAAQTPASAPIEVAPAETGAAGTNGAAGSAHAAATGALGSSRPGARGLAGLDPSYVRRFMASLDRHKQYPRAARARRLEGTTLLWMRMDRSGRVLASKVQKSSGHRVLDRAVLQAIEKANPLPALPASDARAQVELVIPIAFQMR